MSSTRRADDDSVFHQGRYSSSPEFERGLVALPVAKSCSILDDKADRKLVWFIHHLSHSQAGLAGVAASLINQSHAKLGTVAMVQTGKRVGEHFNADEVGQIRKEFPKGIASKFKLPGEVSRADKERFLLERNSIKYDHLDSDSADGESPKAKRLLADLASREAAALECSNQNPSSYPVESFLEVCSDLAKNGSEHYGWKTKPLEDDLREFCLKDARSLRERSPWYFHNLAEAVREYHQSWVAQKSNVVVTTLGARVFENLDFTLETRCLFLMEGNARLGKSFAAKAWCDMHPGQARFVEVPPFNDDAGFFRALARGLGLGNFLNYKAAEIRERVDAVLLTGDLILVLDEAQRLWPQNNLKRGFPSRINWLMTMANAGVPICCVGTPQFIQAQKAMANAGWNSAQLTGRTGGYEFLPVELTNEDLIAVARLALPEAGEDILKGIALYARTSDRHLAAVETISKRARFIAKRAGRGQCTDCDISIAMNNAVVPSDTLLNKTLNQPKLKERPRRSLPTSPAKDRGASESVLPVNTPAVRQIAPAVLQPGGF